MPDHGHLVTTDQLNAAVGEVRVEIANLDKQLTGELAELRTEVRTGFANVNTAIAKLAEQHARTETHRLRWTLGAIVTGSALGVAICASWTVEETPTVRGWHDERQPDANNPG